MIYQQKLQSVSAITNTTFEALGCDDSFYFSSAFLKAFEEANPDIQHTYIVFFRDEKPIALAVTQEIEAPISLFTKRYPILHSLGNYLQLITKPTTLLTTICGNVFLSGNYGIYCKNDRDLKLVAEEVSKLLSASKRSRNSSLYFFKDFNPQDYSAIKVLKEYGYHSFAVAPNMLLPITWDSFTRYKADLKSKYRNKIKKADRTSSVLKVTSLSAKEIHMHLPKLQELYENVSQNSDFNAKNLDLYTYVLLKERFRESVILNTYSIGDEIVGFSTAFKTSNTLDAHFIGLDYKHNRKLALYPRMLNDYVRSAINLGVGTLNLGRTASEIKSTLGAKPEPLSCFVTYKRRVLPLVYKSLLGKLQMTSFKQHSAFKSKIE